MNSKKFIPELILENQKLISDALLALADIIDNTKFNINTINEQRNIKNKLGVIKNRARRIAKNLNSDTNSLENI
jgi:hypothetical protein